MTNSERYRAAFAGVRAPVGAARRALERLEGREAAPPKRRRPLRLALALAAAALLLAGSVGAEMADGAVSNLLAPLFGGAQTDLLDGIGYPVGASVTTDGYTLTADAVIGDRYHMAVVYTLTRNDGEPLSEEIYFGSWSNSVLKGSGGGSLETRRTEDTPANQIHLIERWSGSAPLFRRTATAVFADLTVSGGEEEGAVLAGGPWELSFTLRYRDATVSLPVNKLSVTDEAGGRYEIHEILLSPLGLHLELTAPVPEDGRSSDGSFLRDFQASLVLTDGACVPLTSTTRGGSWTAGDTSATANYGADFETPIPLEDIAALDLCGTLVPVELS